VAGPPAGLAPSASVERAVTGSAPSLSIDHNWFADNGVTPAAPTGKDQPVFARIMVPLTLEWSYCENGRRSFTFGTNAWAARRYVLPLQ